jgi:hypothetical protein
MAKRHHSMPVPDDGRREAKAPSFPLVKPVPDGLRSRLRAPSDLSDLDALAAGSHRPDVQSLIRDGIRRGVIRVMPIPGCPHRVRVVPAPPERDRD